ncbi:hypothetical protein C2E20_0837 [Micractinium conductrix]|uniref:Uncharacterized protein n=1 Tax=Micractinium conductrix TaxID=554055 RepID=A0A2P6VPW1_9CHLO|nr:hypothetical protein C2E20_0837 [Micractinium conductrix]|eukprot:PSC76133.1 hypothetical protein C2E20_0837 [Micractinium conductrix]
MGTGMRADLSFARPEWERAFYEAHTGREAWMERQFHYARAATWAAVLLRTLATGDRVACCIIAAGAVTTLLPAFVDRLPRRCYLRWRLPIMAFDNLLQMALGCYTHGYIYPNPRSGADPSTFQMAAVLLTGNGVAWLLFSSLWGSLPFRFAFPLQAELTLILLHFNRPLCSSNVPIQHAYALLASRLLRRPARLLAALSSFLHPSPAARSCGAAVLAAPAWAAEAVRAACMSSVPASLEHRQGLQQRLAAGGGADVAGDSVATAGAELCLAYQPAILLLFGFLAPTWYIFVTESRQRRRFLAQQAAAGGRQEAGPAAAAAAAAAGMQPSLVEYASFAVPAVAAMYSYAAVQA